MVTGQVSLRPLVEDDLEFLCNLRHHPETLQFLHDPRVFSIGQVCRWFTECRPEWLIVEWSHTRVGYIRVSDKDREAGLLKIGMDIHPAYRRRGVATAAYRYLFERLRQEGWQDIWLEVLSTNGPARALYEKLGFAYVPESNRLITRGGEVIQSLAMRKALGVQDETAAPDG